MRASLLTLLLTAALLSGCVVEDPATETTPQDAEDGQQQAASSSDQEEPAAQEAPAGPHGTPQRTEGAITTGTDAQSYPGAWARRSITITNDFGGATLGDLAAAISAGSILVRAADRDGYLVEATLESRAGTEAEARAILERAHFEHTDVLDGSTLFLTESVRVDPAPASPSPSPVPLPPIVTIGAGSTGVRLDLAITVPLAPAIDLDADASSGDVTASDLHGPRLDVSTSSGEIVATLLRMRDVALSASSGDITVDGLVADSLKAETSSGSIHGQAVTARDVRVSTSSGDAYLEGTLDNIDAESSSGDLTVEATPGSSGKYTFGASSGEVVLLLANTAAYHVDADTSSGEIFVDVPDAEVIEEDEDHVEVASAGYDDADLRTAIEMSTSSGDITVSAD